jgi:hypothetical protein
MPRSASPSRGERPRPGELSVRKDIVAHGPPAVDQVLFFHAPGRRTSRAVMHMQMRGAICDRLPKRHMSLQPLMQIPTLRNVDWTPVAIGQLFRVNVNSRRRFEHRFQRVNFVGISRPGLSGPGIRGGAPHRTGVVAEQMFDQVHLDIREHRTGAASIGRQC